MTEKRNPKGPIGANQAAVLRALVAHNGGTWFPGCGWVWNTPYETAKILDKLVARDLVRRTDTAVRKSGMYPKGVRSEWTITDAGRTKVSGGEV